MKTLSNYSKILLGYNDNQPIYLDAPSWDCGWYWGFGYLGNKNCHYHVDRLTKIETYNHEAKAFTHEIVNLYDGFKRHFGDTFIIKRDKDVWTLAELFKTFYILKETAEVLWNGCSHLASNPCKDFIINKDEVMRINGIVLPQIFEEIYKVLMRNIDSEKVFSKLVNLNLKGDTQKVVEYMKENAIHTDDLKNIKDLTSADVSNINTYYWIDYYTNKNKVATN